jgi:hypothetical protein
MKKLISQIQVTESYLFLNRRPILVKPRPASWAGYFFVNLFINSS